MLSSELPTQYSPFLGIPYRLSQGPHLLRSDQEPYDLQSGVNCQLLIHALYREMSVVLPLALLSYELFHDTEFFMQIAHDEPHMEADIFFFASDQTLQDPMRYHLAYAAGLSNEHHTSLLLHASFLRGVELQSLEHFLRLQRYKHLVAIKRLRPEFHSLLCSSASTSAPRNGR